MRVELIIYLYGAVCVSMIVFNIIYNLILKGSQPRLARRRRRLEARIGPQLARLGRGERVQPRHLAELQRTLRRVQNLIAFDQLLKPRLQGEEAAVYSAYLAEIQPAILSLALFYHKRDTMRAAYFSYFLSRYMAPRHMLVHSIQGVLLDYIRRDNLYFRINALQALYRFGSPESILAALEIQDRDEVFLHEKILTEGLLSFTGDHRALIGLLWARLDEFSERTQLAISNYIRFQSGEYTEEMLSILLDEKWGKELRLSAIRYFGRYRYDPALEPLLAFARQRDPEQWEYATVSVSALARYPEERVVDVLVGALHSSNWYVRYAAAASLEAQQVDYPALLDVMAGNDRYAREMMMYRLENRRTQKAGV